MSAFTVGRYDVAATSAIRGGTAHKETDQKLIFGRKRVNTGLCSGSFNWIHVPDSFGDL